MKRVIVTGANGFVGRAVVRKLAEKGYYIYAVVRESCTDTAELKSIKNVEIVFLNMNHYDCLKNKIPENTFTAFYHFAWEGSAGAARGSEKVQLENVRNSCRAVRSAGNMGVKRFIFASSIMEYEIIKLMGRRMSPPVSSQYCTAKIAADFMCRTIANDQGMEYVSGIISNIYGPGEKSQRLVNTSIKKLLNGERASFTPGEQLYDFIYITDAAELFALLAENGSSNGAYYIGSGKPKKLKEFLWELGEAVSSKDDIRLGDLDFQGISLSYHEFDISAAARELGYQTKIDFKEGIKMTADWIRAVSGSGKTPLTGGGGSPGNIHYAYPEGRCA